MLTRKVRVGASRALNMNLSTSMTCGHKKATSKRLPATVNTGVASMAVTKTKHILNRRQSLRWTAFVTCLQ